MQTTASLLSWNFLRQSNLMQLTRPFKPQLHCHPHPQPHPQSLLSSSTLSALSQSVDHAHSFLREKNTGLTPDGKTFGEVMDHFALGGDETCFLASSGDVKIIGDKEKPKHDLPTGTSRTSTTVYRIGSTAGTTGPTAFLPR